LSAPAYRLAAKTCTPRLPSWRRHEYREALKAYAAKHGKPMSNAEAMQTWREVVAAA
jgi:hypothetical protein